jgi:hypothetical protein
MWTRRVAVEPDGHNVEAVSRSSPTATNVEAVHP